MSDTLREAENLLKTIVASSARLSTLRGKTDPTLDIGDLGEGAPETSSIPEGGAEVVRSELETGIDPEPAMEHELAMEPPAKPLTLGIDDDTEMDSPPIRDFDLPTQEEFPEPSADERDFSFLDLIPADSGAAELSEPTTDGEPLDTPPPVRAKPLMPLPVGLAAGAPSTPPPPTVDEPANKPSELIEVIEPVEAIELLQSAQSPQDPYTLSAPRAVAPQILDPDRERLEVEVYETEDSEADQLDFPPLDAPRLTESASMEETHNRPTPVIPREQPEEAILDALSQAKALVGRGDLSAAQVHLSDVLDWEPGHIEARLTRGRCSRDLGDPIAAMSDFERAIQLAPFSPEAHVEMGDIFFARKDYGRAIQHYTDALERDPNHPMALCRRGICHHYRQRPESALDDLNSARLAAPDIPNIDRYIRMVSPPQR